MTFQVNTSPFSGQDGKYLTSRQIRERLDRELIANVALRVEDTQDPDKFKVSGRGELHLSILLETMRREGYELAVSQPEVVLKTEGENILEPFEQLTVDIEESHQGSIMEKLAMRKGELKNIKVMSGGRVRLDYIIPTRGLIGFHTEFLNLTSGTRLISSILLTPPVKFSLEQALEFINSDELVEITPTNIRMRKKFLKEHERKKAARSA